MFESHLMNDTFLEKKQEKRSTQHEGLRWHVASYWAYGVDLGA